jgi:predicted Zn-dependent protease
MEAILAEAFAAEREGRLDAAARLYEHLVKGFPKRWEGWVYGARALRRLGRLDAAQKHVAAGLRALPSSPGLLIEKADLAFQRGDHRAVIEICAALRAAAPERPEGTVIAMRALNASGNAQGAMALGMAAKAQGIADVGLEAELVQTHLLLGERDTARSMVVQIVAAAPDNLWARLTAIGLLREVGRTEDAAALVGEGLALHGQVDVLAREAAELGL